METNTSPNKQNVTSEPGFCLRLFGNPAATVNGSPIARLRSRKGLWLLSILALRNGREIARETLAGLLWPDSYESASLASLRQCLTDLRKGISTEAWRIKSPTSQTLALDLSGAYVDVLEFDRRCKSNQLDDLRLAIELYKGDLVEGCTEDWLLLEREQREQSVILALEQLASLELERGEPEPAIAAIKHLVLLDPYRESAHRQLMQILASTGNYAAASLHYRELRFRLRQDLNGAPSPETVALYEQLRADAKRRMVRLPDSNGTLSEGNEARIDAVSHPKIRLPQPLTNLIGREEETEHLLRTISSHRLTTLLGTGGVGKTRLSIHVAQLMSAEFEDGIFFVDLASVTKGPQVSQAVTEVLEIIEEVGISLKDSLISKLQNCQTLILLDNCEHLIDECAQIVTYILTRCPNVKILITSRQALGVLGEKLCAVAPLPVPGHRLPAAFAPEDIGSIIAYDSVKLFLERAQSIVPGFVLTEENAADVAAICRRLDGIPLAIELAAPRLRALSPSQICARLKDRFRLLKGGDPTRLKRQQTLQALIDWSFDLLDAREKTLFVRLSAFAGEFDLEAAEQVAGDRASDAESVEERELPIEDVWEALSSLVDKSLLVSRDGQTDRLYRMFDSIKHYAQDRCRDHNLLPDLQERHLKYCVSTAEFCGQSLRTNLRDRAIIRMNRTADDVQACLDFCENHAEYHEYHLRILAGLWRGWMTMGHLKAGSIRLESALRTVTPAALLSLRIQVLNGAAGLAWNVSDYERANRHLNEGLQLANSTKDESAAAQIIFSLGNIAYSTGHYGEARRHYEESLSVRKRLNDETAVASCVNNLAIVFHALKEFELAMEYHQQGMAFAEKMEDEFGIVTAVIGMGNVYKEMGDLDAAEEMFRKSLSLNLNLCDPESTSGCLLNIANILCMKGRAEEARDLLVESIQIALEIGDRRGVTDALDNLAEVQRAAGNLKAAANIYGVVERMREEINTPRTPGDQSMYAKITNKMQQVMGRESYHDTFAAGKAMSVGAAVAMAIAPS